MGSHVSRAPAEAAAIMTALRRIVRHLRLADRQAESAAGISAAQLFVLHTLADAPGSSLAELAQRTLTDPSSVSTVVARLARAGLVARARAARDTRRWELTLTAAGRRLVARERRPPQGALVAQVQALPAARRTALARALADLVTLLGADEVAPRMLFEDEPRTARRARAR